MGLAGLVFLLVFFVLLVIFAWRARRQPPATFRTIPAFDRLGRSIGLAVESGRRLHVSLGRGAFTGIPAASALVGLGILERIARLASVSDRPPVATSGEGVLAILSQDTIRSTYKAIGASAQYDPASGRMSGATPLSYAAGILPILHDEQVSTSILAGNFGSEVALITDAAERAGNMTLAGSDSLTAQAVLFAGAEEPLIGEELYAAGAYMRNNPVNTASLRVQDIFRWVLIAGMLAAAALKFVGLP